MLDTGVLADRLKKRLAERPERSVVTVCGARIAQPDQSLTGRELHQAASAMSADLTSRYGGRSGPLALVMPCSLEFVVTLFGAIYAGITVTALAPPRPGLAASRFARIVRDCAPSAILCPDDWRPRIDAALAGTDEVRDAGPSSIRASMAADKAAILQYTSGSTRSPKAVMVSQANVVANGTFTNSAWGMDENEVFLSWLPHFHDLGLMSILYPILSGGRTILLDPLAMIQRPERWLRLISEHRVTMSGGPAFAFAHCLSNVSESQCEGLDLSSWRSAFCGAEPVPSSLLAAFRERYAPHGLNPEAVFGTYGLAEFTLMVAGETPRPGAERPVAPDGCGDVEPCRIGSAMRDNLRLVDADSRRCAPAGQAGEIWVRGPSVALGYRNDPAETQATFGAVLADDGSDGWLRTGDIGLIQDDWLYVTGRLKDLLFANGRKIPATDVEWLAGEQDDALNPMAATALMADELVSGKAVLLIERRRRAVIVDEAAVREAICRAVAGAWAIELTEVRFVPSGALPRTTSGKIQRRIIAAAWREGRLDEVLQ